MTYPPEPGGYEPQPGGYQPLPQYPGQVDPEAAPPSGATAITAGVLALLGALAGIVLAIILGLALAGFNSARAADTAGANVDSNVVTGLSVSVVVIVLWTLCLAIGGILLFLRKRPGQILVLIGSGLTIVLCLFAAFGLSSGAAEASLNGRETIGSGVVGLLVIGLPAVVTFVLAIISPTNRYIKWRPGQGGNFGPPPPPPPPGQYPSSGGQQW